MDEEERQKFFEEQRDALVGDISRNMEYVLTNLSTLNRSLESIINVGLDFDNVYALWKNYYDGMPEPDKSESQQ